MQPTADFYTAAHACIEKVVRAYRPKILEAHGNIDPSIKPDATPVTLFDQELEQLLREALTNFDQSIGFEGEELGKTGNENTFWLIDPIDGTESFVRGLPFVRNIVTLINDNQPVFTLVYRPISDELLIATKGGGAFKNGQAIHASSRPLSRAWIDLSISITDNSAINLVQKIRPHINGFRNIGEFTFVAQGQIDGQLLYRAGGGPWDYAPRALLMSEAGGRVANIGSDTYDFRNNDALMTNSVIFDDLMKIIVAAI
jgi:fructose-1,6-bisphosphatase/inositol monophosphatase family enzyme